MVEGMSNLSPDFDFCQNCVYGKHNIVSFSSSAKREKQILELVHNDVFRPVSVPSLGKSVYYVSLIDDFSRNTWIYFLRNKFEVFDKFKEFKALVENQTEKKIKVLRTDNGGEFCKKEFEEFYKKCGIVRQNTTPYTPEKNGVAERMNKTLMPVLPKEHEKIEFELKEEELDSTTEEESEDEKPQTPTVRRSVRERKQLERYSPSTFCSNFSLSITDDDPITLREVVDLEDGKLWRKAMVDEMTSLHKSEAWDLVELKTRRKPIGRKWVFKKKMNAEARWRNAKLGW
eukprot:PITA_34991